MAEKKMIETMEFDNYAYAKDVLEQSKMQLEKISQARKIAVAATCCTFLGLVLRNVDGFESTFMLLALAGSIVSYIKGGGFKIALKAALKVSNIGWMIVPIPWNIATGIGALAYSFLAFLFMPIIFVHMNYRQYKQYCDDAETYIKYCRETTTIVEE